MLAQGQGGKIINTASIAGRQGYAEFASYCASKASVISLTQAAAREFAKHKITVNAFAPGVVVTPLWDGLEQDMIDKGVIKQKGEFIESFSVGDCSWSAFEAGGYRRHRRVPRLFQLRLHHWTSDHVGRRRWCWSEAAFRRIGARARASLTPVQATPDVGRKYSF